LCVQLIPRVFIPAVIPLNSNNTVHGSLHQRLLDHLRAGCFPSYRFAPGYRQKVPFAIRWNPAVQLVLHFNVVIAIVDSHTHHKLSLHAITIADLYSQTMIIRAMRSPAEAKAECFSYMQPRAFTSVRCACCLHQHVAVIRIPWALMSSYVQLMTTFSSSQAKGVH
jgi:hypothetical protein